MGMGVELFLAGEAAGWANKKAAIVAKRDQS